MGQQSLPLTVRGGVEGGVFEKSVWRKCWYANGEINQRRTHDTENVKVAPHRLDFSQIVGGTSQERTCYGKLGDWIQMEDVSEGKLIFGWGKGVLQVFPLPISQGWCWMETSHFWKRAKPIFRPFLGLLVFFWKKALWLNAGFITLTTWRGDAQRYWLVQVLETAWVRRDQWLQTLQTNKPASNPPTVLVIARRSQKQPKQSRVSLGQNSSMWSLRRWRMPVCNMATAPQNSSSGIYHEAVDSTARRQWGDNAHSTKDTAFNSRSGIQVVRRNAT